MSKTRDLSAALEQFWDLPKEKRRRVFEGNAEAPGGRDLDAGQIYWTIEGGVRDFYPINRVPADVVAALADLRLQALVLEQTYAEILSCMIRDIDGPKEER